MILITKTPQNNNNMNKSFFMIILCTAVIAFAMGCSDNKAADKTPVTAAPKPILKTALELIKQARALPG